MKHLPPPPRIDGRSIIARFQLWSLPVLPLLLFLLTAVRGLPQDKFIAYAVPTNTIGNQAFGGSLGMEFEVLNPVVITRLGAFDDDGDGLNLPIMVRLFDRADETSPVELASMEFTPDAPGDLVGGSRFKTLAPTLSLPAGFKGTIVAEGYGEGERLRNSGVSGGVVWETRDGNGSLAFTGTSRWGNAGEYPGTADAGPAARYAAGTFEFQSTPPVKPGKPGGVTVTAGDGQITLTWQAVTNPLPAAKYQVYRASTPDGASNQVAEVTVTRYADTNLVNGQLYSYYVRALGANGQVGEFTARLNAAPYVLETNLVVAYFVPPAVAGNQAFDGVLGMDFDVVNPIVVTRLGVFDDSTDGLKRNLTARIYNRADPTSPVEMAALEFTTDSPGTLIGGTRFKDLPQPLRLAAGFKGTVTAENYGAEEKLCNSDGNTNQILWQLNDGNQSIRFVGTSRYGTTQGSYADVADGGPAARYAAGSFLYQTTDPQYPGIPTVRASRVDRGVKLTWDAVSKPLPAAAYRVYRLGADGQATRLSEVTATEFTQTGMVKGELVTLFVRAVAANGNESADSTQITLTVEAREAGIAYQVEPGTLGTQAYGGNLGMDFDVLTPIKVTQLGVFDDSSDGLFLTLTARVFNRATQEEVARLEFTPTDAGTLNGGSRFKTLPTPLVLPAGFQGTIAASGYGDGERLGNNVSGRATFSAADALAFVGTARYGDDPAAFPGSPDAGPANRYATGTFYFEPLAEQPRLTLQAQGGKLTLTWTGVGTLEKAAQVNGPWTAVPGAASGLQVQPTDGSAFYRVRM